MNHSDKEPLPFCRYNPWDDEEFILSLSEDTVLPGCCFFPEDGIPQRTPDRYFDYRFDLMLEAENALREFLGILVDFKQRKKLMQFLLFFCDELEISCQKSNGALLECRFRVEFSDRISFLYSSKMCGCIVFLDGKQNLFHNISPDAIDDLRRLLAQMWEQMRQLPVWEIATEDDRTVTFRRRETRRFNIRNMGKLSEENTMTGGRYGQQGILK